MIYCEFLLGIVDWIKEIMWIIIGYWFCISRYIIKLDIFLFMLICWRGGGIKYILGENKIIWVLIFYGLIIFIKILCMKKLKLNELIEDY